MIRTRILRSALIVSALLACSSTVLAQGGTGGMSVGEDPKATADVRPPAPGEPAPPSTALLYITLFLLGGVAFGVAVMPSRRTHQD